MSRFVLAIDQGTTTSRAIVFDHSARPVSVGQLEHRQIMPRAGWVEHDAMEIWDNVREAVGVALSRADLSHVDIAAVGITNQRETTVIWDRTTGEPVCNALVWQDTRTQPIVDEMADGDTDRYREVTGLPLATYFSAPKIKWVLDNVDGVRWAAERGRLLFGTTDSWVLWNLTGGVEGGVHFSDPTNASRTQLLDIRALRWDEAILDEVGIPASLLPELRPSSHVYGHGRPDGALPGVPIAGVLGDQQAALVGQCCFLEGMAKNTYGTGNFLLMNTGGIPIQSNSGLITSVGYQFGDDPPVYVLEGSIAVTGSLVQWLRDQLGMFEEASDVEDLAGQVEDNGGAYLVPAFSGLFAPHWRPDARGAIVGLTRYVNRGHIARAALEATAYQTRDVVAAMNTDAGLDLKELRVDGGMVSNDLLMQFQADQLGVDVVRPAVHETTSLGAAFAAGLAVGFWEGTDQLAATWAEEKRWTPSSDRREMDRLYRNWAKALTKSMGWVDDDVGV